MKLLWRAIAALGDAWRNARRDHTPFLAGGLSFFALLSLLPAGVLALSIGGAVWGDGAAADRLLGAVSRHGGALAAGLLSVALRGEHRPAAGWLGAAAVLFGASIVFIQLRNALNLLWGIDIRRGFRNVLLGRLAAFATMLLAGAVTAGGFVLHAVLGAAAGRLSAVAPVLLRVREWSAVGNALAFLMLTVLLVVIYRLLPSVRLPARYAWAGAAVTAAFMAMATVVAGAYFQRFPMRGLHGAGAALFVALLWVYVSAEAFLYGAEFTRAFAERCGWTFHVVPKEVVDAQKENENR